MEIIRIGNDKLKLILTDGDLKKYSLKTERLDYDNTETRRVLWQILDEAKKETGFDAAAERTLVQAYPGRRGGCEIYVTRLIRPTGCHGREEVYRFEDADSLFRAAEFTGNGNFSCFGFSLPSRSSQKTELFPLYVKRKSLFFARVAPT